MKYVDEFRDRAVADGVVRALHARVTPGRRYRLMEFCGGHTHALCRFGLMSLLPPEIELIHGPGCPVCVLPIGRLEQAIQLARQPGVILATYGDMLRVPAKDRVSLMRARSEGADVRVVFGAEDALRLAEANPTREVVFFAIGFETTTPTTAVAVKTAARRGLRNFSLFVNHVTTPAALTALLSPVDDGHGGPPPPRTDEGTRVDGFVGPGHVSTILGVAPYRAFAAQHRRPIVIAGFEPLDLLQAILMLVTQLEEGRHEVENQFTRAVVEHGNPIALRLIEETLELRPTFEWRGLGELPSSALRLREAYRAFDAEARFELPYASIADHRACACPDILRGKKKPTDCKIFGTGCTPEHPMGSCMVSPEGSCAAYFAYGRRAVRRAPARAGLALGPDLAPHLAPNGGTTP